MRAYRRPFRPFVALERCAVLTIPLRYQLNKIHNPVLFFNGVWSKRRQTKTATGPKQTYKLAFVNYGPFSVLLTTFQLSQLYSSCSAVIS